MSSSRPEILSDGQHLRISTHSVTSIPALSAVQLSGRNLMVVLQPLQELRIFAAPTVPLLLIDLTSRPFDDLGPLLVSSNRPAPLNIGYGPTTSSPQVNAKGSSQPVFSPHFSPVPDHAAHTPLPGSAAASTRILALTPGMGGKFLVEMADGLRLLRVPERPSSEVIDLCVNALRHHIDSDLFSLIFSEVTKLGFDGRRRNFSLQDRWNTFFTAVLAKLACAVVVVDTEAPEMDGNYTGISSWTSMRSRMESRSAIGK